MLVDSFSESRNTSSPRVTRAVPRTTVQIDQLPRPVLARKRPEPPARTTREDYGLNDELDSGFVCCGDQAGRRHGVVHASRSRQTCVWSICVWPIYRPAYNGHFEQDGHMNLYAHPH